MKIRIRIRIDKVDQKKRKVIDFIDPSEFMIQNSNQKFLSISSIVVHCNLFRNWWYYDLFNELLKIDGCELHKKNLDILFHWTFNS
jgi:hypothetical protein